MDAIEKVLHECGQKPQALMILGGADLLTLHEELNLSNT